MSDNLFAQFRRLVGQRPLQFGEVIAIDGESATIEMPDGGRLQARGSATIGAKVYLRDGVIEAEAPNLPLQLIEL